MSRKGREGGCSERGEILRDDSKTGAVCRYANDREMRSFDIETGNFGVKGIM